MTESLGRLSAPRFRSRFPDATGHDFRTGAWRVGVPGADEAVAPYFPTLVHALNTASELATDIGITLLPDDEEDSSQFQSFSTIYKKASQLALEFERSGITKGQRVLLVLPTSFEFVLTFFALQMLGAIPVPAYPAAVLERLELALERISAIGRASGASFCVMTRPMRPLLGDLANKVPSLRSLLTVDKMLEALDDNDAVMESMAWPIKETTTAFLQFTSGSTDVPKGVTLTHRNVISNIHVIGQALKISRHDRVCSWLPLYHDMGLIGALLFSFYWRIPLWLMSPVAFLLRPVRWLRTISEARATLSPAPNFAYGLCVKRVRDRDISGLDLSSWRLALNGAEPVNEATVSAFEAKFGPHGFSGSSMYPVYGLAESCLAVSFPRPEEPRRFLRVDRAALTEGAVVESSGEGSMAIACVGRAVPGHSVRVVDEGGDDVAAGQVGHILAKGPSVMKGYFELADVTESVLQDNWLWTGDLGFLGADGLYVTGRAKDLILVRGKNFYAEDIERVVEAIDGVRTGGVVAFGVYDDEQAGDVVVIVVETSRDEKEHDPLAETISTKVSEVHGLVVDEVVIVEPGAISKTSSGKRQRGATRKRYLSGQLDPEKTGRLGLMRVFARSASGYARLLGRKLRSGRTEPP